LKNFKEIELALTLFFRIDAMWALAGLFGIELEVAEAGF
jgi:hypothetical protein